jgi:Tfp pilus assembly protein FimT
MFRKGHGDKKNIVKQRGRSVSRYRRFERTAGNITRADGGFSLVELTLIVGVSVVLMAISIPVLSSSMRDMQLASDARKIATSLAVARMSATAHMTHCRLLFDLDGNDWRLERLNRSTGQFELQQADNALSSEIATSGIAFKSNSSTAPPGFPTASSTAITFNSRGIPIDGAGVPSADNIIYLSKGDADFAVSVSLAGKVQLWRLKDGQWVAQ